MLFHYFPSAPKLNGKYSGKMRGCMDKNKNYLLPHTSLPLLLNILSQSGYLCIGPQVHEGSIVYKEIKESSELPWGIIDHQKPGYYRIEKTNRKAAFLFTNGPQGMKPYLFQSSQELWEVQRDPTPKTNSTIKFNSGGASVNGNHHYHSSRHSISKKKNSSKVAYLGAKACDLAALAIQDRIFLGDKYIDPYYQSYRENLFIIAVNCTRSSTNCFCVATGDGPKVTKLFDIVMTELEDQESLLIKAGTIYGEKIITELQAENALRDASSEKVTLAEEVINRAASEQTKKLPPTSLRDLLFANLEHPRWIEVAKRCLSCSNCTQVCPTCFCHSSMELPSLDGKQSKHLRVWDSCFTSGHSYIHGHVIRNDIRKRYRQWLTHKVGSWFDQFGMSGCIGCGRCITWCPTGIDITEETDAIYRSDVRNMQK